MLDNSVDMFRSIVNMHLAVRGKKLEEGVYLPIPLTSFP
jgi:hypothetical protein